MGERICSVENCKRPHYGRGFCNMHYSRWRRWGDPLNHGNRNVPRLPCSIEGCDTISASWGWCEKHLHRWKRWGDPLARPEHGRRDYRRPVPGQKRSQLDIMLWANYRITEKDYLDLLRQQDGVCAICGSYPTPRRRLVVDHDHESGAVRGLLCPSCNAGVGMLKDDVAVLQSAISYLGS